MNFIIYDLEATCWEDSFPERQSEIIEIGATKVNAYGETEETFCRFVKPIIHPRLSFYCTELTTITQKQVDNASSFNSVIEDFQDWIDIFNEDYVLCSWGSFDKKMLIQDCELHRMESDWVDKHINLKRQYHQFRGLRRLRGLKYTVEKEGFEFSGSHHRGIDDAINLSKVFKKHIDVWRY